MSKRVEAKKKAASWINKRIKNFIIEEEDEVRDPTTADETSQSTTESSVRIETTVADATKPTREISDDTPSNVEDETSDDEKTDPLNARDEEESASLREKFALLYQRFQDIKNVYIFYRNIVQNMSSALITIDMDSTITFLNVAGSKTLGYHVDDLLGKKLREIFSGSDKNHRILDLILIPGKKYEGKEVRLITKDGRNIPVGFTTSPLIDDHKKQIGVIIIFRDLTEMNIMRRQIERMDRLATLGELSTSIAHEVRNPLAGMKACAQVVEETFEPNDKRIELIQRIVKEIDRTNNLLNDFFKFAKPRKPAKGYCDVEMIIDNVYLLVATQMKKHNITYKENFKRVTPQVYVDMNQIEQVILNIMINAIQQMNEGGTVKSRTYTTTVGDKPNLDWDEEVYDTKLSFVAIEISDSGPGIPKENIEKIFNPFFTTKEGGTGLGLSISSRLVEENGGKLYVESQPGEGSVFTIILPTS